MNGEIYRQVGKYARGAVLYAFENIGGPDGLVEWAEANQDEFYTKLFPKIIARESEVQHVRGVDDLMDLLDADYEVIDGDVPEAEVIPSEVPVDIAMETGTGGWPVDDMETKQNSYEEIVSNYDFDVDDFVEFEE